MVIRTRFNLATLALAFMAFTASTQADSASFISLYPRLDCTTAGTDLDPVINNMTTPLTPYGCATSGMCISYLTYPFLSVDVSDEEGNTDCSFYEDDNCGDREISSGGSWTWHKIPPNYTMSVTKQKNVCGNSPAGPMTSYICVRNLCRK